ncbi:MAG: CoA transferase [Chloroflexi bacterium]|nr:CoA transferase [Chloroflexota bacterium]
MSLPLEGLRIIDFSWGAAGPYATSIAAQLGAEVIKIETGNRLDFSRRTLDASTGKLRDVNRSLTYHYVNAAKLGVTLNLKQPEAVVIARRLVQLGDVVVESFQPGVMSRWGMDYWSLKKTKPDLVMLSTSAAGQTGPEAEAIGFAPLFAGLGGLGELTGYSDGPPTEIRFTIDLACAAYNAFALFAALRHRTEHGEGTYIDASSQEAVACLVGESILDYTANGKVATRQGNRDDFMAPHNCYPCSGHDKWITIAVSTETEWEALCKASDHEAWLRDPRFQDRRGRLEHADALDALLAQWTVQFTPYALMHLLQKHGVAAAPSMNAEDLFTDPHVNAQGAWKVAEDAALGARVSLELPFVFSQSAPPVSKRGPLLGEHNDYVFRDLLGLSAREMGELKAMGALS